MLAKILLLRSNSYAYAEGWDDLVNAFTGLLKHSTLDEMVLLLHADALVPREQGLEYVHPVTYNTEEEIPQLLLSTARVS